MTYPTQEQVREIVDANGGESSHAIARAALRLGVSWYEAADLYRAGCLSSHSEAWKRIREQADEAR